MGGGRQCLQSNVRDADNDPIDTWACYSKDGRDLFKAWSDDKMKRQLRHKIVTNNDELNKLDVNVTDYVLGKSKSVNFNLGWAEPEFRDSVKHSLSVQYFSEDGGFTKKLFGCKDFVSRKSLKNVGPNQKNIIAKLSLRMTVFTHTKKQNRKVPVYI